MEIRNKTYDVVLCCNDIDILHVDGYAGSKPGQNAIRFWLIGDYSNTANYRLNIYNDCRILDCLLGKVLLGE